MDQVSIPESDAELRNRVRYVADSSREIETAIGAHLEAIAWRYGLRRLETIVRAEHEEVTPLW